MKKHDDDGIEIIDPDNIDDGINIIDPEDINATDTAYDNEDIETHKPSDIAKIQSDATSRRSSLIRNAVMAVSCLVFVISAGMLIYIFMGYHKADKIYSSVENSVFVPVSPTTASDDNNTDAPTDGAVVEDTVISGFTYNHDALLEINPDSIGYMVIPAVNIYLPIVQGSDNSYYLTHAVNGSYSGNGTLFIDYRIDKGLEASNTIIYGHAMKNGSMFGSLYKFKDQDFLNTGSNNTFYIYTENKIYTYKIYSVHVTPEISTAYTYEFADTDSFQSFLDDMCDQSIITTDTKVSTDDVTVTLSTCTNDSTTRLVVQAVRTDITVTDNVQ